MYARLVLFMLGPGMRSALEEIADELIPKVIARKGFISESFFSNEEGECGSFVLYETKEDAESTKEALLPVLQSKLTGIAKGPPIVKLFEVYEPKV